MSLIYGDFDVSNFWVKSDYADKEYVCPPFDDDTIEEIQEDLGYKLPLTYIELMRTQNGGIPNRTSHKTKPDCSSANHHVAIHAIFGIDTIRFNSIGYSQFWHVEWGYPLIGIYFADCPSAGHDMVCMDYRGCGPSGEPSIVHISQIGGFIISHLADDFESFIRGLEPKEAIDEG